MKTSCGGNSARFSVLWPFILLMGCTGPVSDGPVDPPDWTRASLGDGVHYWRIETSDDDLDALYGDIDADIDVPAILLTEDDFYRVEVEIQGASSRRFPKLSYKLKFDDPFQGLVFEQEGEPFSRLILKAMYSDQSLTREAIAFDLARETGQMAPRTDFVWLEINGEPEGLFVLVEQVNEDFLAHRALDEAGYLFKAVRKHGADADFHPNSDIALAFEEKLLDERPDGYELLERFVETLQTFNPETPESLDHRLSVDAYLDRICWGAFTQNVDATRQNFFLYSPDGQRDWTWIAWDSDVSLSNHWRLQHEVLPPEDLPLMDGGNYFSRRLLQHEATREHYVSRCMGQLQDTWTDDLLMSLVDAYEERLTAAIDADLRLWERTSTAREEFEEVRAFFRSRPFVLKDAMEELLGT